MQNCITEVCLKNSPWSLSSFTRSFLKLSHDLDSTALYPIRSVQETIQSWAQRPGGHGSASMLAPKRRTTVMKSVVYLETNLKHQHHSDARCALQHWAHPCMYRWYLPISVCECTNVFYLSLYVRLGFANVKGLSWTEAPEICSSSSSEQLLSVLTSPHPTASNLLF